MRTLAPSSAQPDYSAGKHALSLSRRFRYHLQPRYPLFAAGTNGPAAPSPSRTQQHQAQRRGSVSFHGRSPANDPTVTLDGADPGLVAHDQDESTLDAEWSGAAAPAATVNLVVAASTATTDGIDLALAYIVNHTAAPVVSVSYGSCEQEMGAAELAFYNSLWQQAASEGMSVFVASGDAGAAGCSARHGRLRIASRSEWPLLLALLHLRRRHRVQRRRRMLRNTGRQQTPRVTVRRSATSPKRYGTRAHRTVAQDYGPQAEAQVSYYPQPAWQANIDGAGAANGMRAVPDVALAAADHDGYFVVENGSFWIASGTSAATPSFAGIMALVIQSQHGVPQGNANPRLYALASAAGDPFHPTPSGDNSVPGAAGFSASGARIQFGHRPRFGRRRVARQRLEHSL